VPLSLLFAGAVGARRALYRLGVLRSHRLPVPVVVVGNIFVGGTGKTPLTLALVQDLVKAGHRPGVVCSGYGGRREHPSKVEARSDPADVGDEPVLIAQRSGCPVWSGRDRVAAARQLLSRSSCDVIVCDDGLQHYRLARDFEIDVMDERRVGNGLMLPAGPLRESKARPVDARVMNGGGPGGFSMVLEAERLYRLERPDELVEAEQLRALRLHAIAGTGNPRRFFDSLARLRLQFEAHAFPDHHGFTVDDLSFIDCDAILMTEKDAVKCARLDRSALPPLYALRVDANVDPALFESVRLRIKQVRR
jgi:tetraacyldisaccharide 4'-kinase